MEVLVFERHRLALTGHVRSLRGPLDLFDELAIQLIPWRSEQNARKRRRRSATRGANSNADHRAHKIGEWSCASCGAAATRSAPARPGAELPVSTSVSCAKIARRLQPSGGLPGTPFIPVYTQGMALYRYIPVYTAAAGAIPGIPPPIRKVDPVAIEFSTPRGSLETRVSGSTGRG